jgi:hypothetical protein
MHRNDECLLQLMKIKALSMIHNQVQALSTDFFSLVNLFTLPTEIKSRYLKGSQNSVIKILIDMLTKHGTEMIHHK